MEDLTDKILKLLQEEEIAPNEIRNTLSKIVEEIDQKLWVKLSLSLPLFYNLKDTVWYNLEHLQNGGKEKGMDNLRLMGTKYPTLMFDGNNDIYISNSKLPMLLLELEEISSKWSNDWAFVQLFTKSLDGWNGGTENPSPVVIYDPNQGESPAKYGYKYNQKQFNVFDSKGEYMTHEKHEMVLCSIETKLGTYGREPMIRSQLDRLIDACKKGISSNKGIMLDIESYDYSS